MRIKISDHFTMGKLLRFVVPSIIMMLFTSVYGVVDGFFVSNFVGKTPFASINLVMPFLMILGGVGFMIGTGGSALVSKTLGEGDSEKANRYFTMMIKLTVLLGLVLTVIGIVFIKPVSLFLGATEEMLPHCIEYGITVNAFVISFMLQNVFQSLLVTAEKPKMGLVVTIIAGCTNMVLDLLFVGVFGWGLIGAGVATGISQCVGGIIPLVYFLKDNNSLLRLVKTKLELKPIIKACTNGASELMGNISSSIVSILYNFQLMTYLGEDGVSAYGVIMYVQFIFIAIAIGYSIGCAPIVGYNYGAQNHAELKNVFKKSMMFTISSGLILFGLSEALAYPLSYIFVGYDAQLMSLTTHAFAIFSFVFLFASFNIFTSAFFTALNNGLISAIVSFLRTLVFQTACILVLPPVVGVEGIWLSVIVAEVLTTIVDVVFLIGNKNKYHYA